MKGRKKQSMNNLFGNPFTPPRSMPMARSGEPVPVNGFESVKTFPTLPNTITILFHDKDKLFYRIETDANNHPAYRFFKYFEIESPVDKTRAATLEDLDKMKEDLINEWQHFWNEPTANATNANYSAAAGNTAIDASVGSKPDSGADASNSSEQESSIW